VQRAESDLFAHARELEAVNAALRTLGNRERRTARALAGLATAVSALAGAEDRADLFRRLFRHGPAALEADALAVALLEPGGRRLQLVDAHPSADRAARTSLAVDSRAVLAAARTGRATYQPDAGNGFAGEAPFPGVRAWAALPLRVGQRSQGCLTVGWQRPRVLDDADVRVLEAFAAQCAQALDRVARLETERRQSSATRSLVETLQRSLLVEPPQPDHLDIAVRYRSATREAHIGGDWYDAFQSPSGGTTLVVGDVTGHDQAAAVVAGQLRSMLRGIAYALDDAGPDLVLSTLDDACHHSGLHTLATALLAHVEESTTHGRDRWYTLRWSNAGHPPPLLIAPDGTGELLERPADLLLGAVPDAPRRRHVVTLRPGDTVVLYTDGLIERRDATLDDGFDRLVAVAPALASRPVDELCGEILTRLNPDLSDDVALLAFRVRTAPRTGP
jgi:serine phosphatase RsbU (regulator of sigma subunit)